MSRSASGAIRRSICRRSRSCRTTAGSASCRGGTGLRWRSRPIGGR
nr:MAG TPA: hypothetical protein [Caudoviricetes sp.]